MWRTGLAVWTAVAWLVRTTRVEALQRPSPFHGKRFLTNRVKVSNANDASSKDEFKASFTREYVRDLEVEVSSLSPIVVFDYEGPMGDFSQMEAGCVIEDLGIEVLVGNSTVPNAGRGLFIALQDGVEEVTLPRGTPICGYSKGIFSFEGEGDKTVAYAFQSLNNGVIYDKKIASIRAIIQSVSNSTEDLSTVIDGHLVYFDDEAQEMCIAPTDDYLNRYFIPFEDQEWSPASFGTQANDLGYHKDISNFDEYIENSVKKNILQIVWRMELIEGRFKPSWPVVILNRDVRFTNAYPMEVGIHYSWNFWRAALSKVGQKQNLLVETAS